MIEWGHMMYVKHGGGHLSCHTPSTTNTRGGGGGNMRYTEKWVQWKRRRLVASGTYNVKLYGNPITCNRVYTTISDGWMRDYRARVQAIDTQEKASQAIRDYWHMVAREWDNGRGIISLRKRVKNNVDRG